MIFRRLMTGRKEWSPGRVLLLALLLSAGPARAAPPLEVLNTASAQFINPPGVTNQISYGPVRALVQSLPTNVPPPLIHYYRDDTFSATINVTALGSPLFVQASAMMCNSNSAVAETHPIELTSARTGDRETFLGVETAPNSGVFRILPTVSTRDERRSAMQPGNGIIETLANDTVTATIDAGGTNRAVAKILISPGGGMVFDSSTGLPVANALVTLLDASSGLPALVYQSDARTPSLNPVTTGPDGVYLFPLLLPGVYKLQVLPPPGYRSPSKVALDRLPNERTIASPGSFGGSFAMPLGAGPVQFDYPVDPVQDNGSGLFIQKLVSVALAEVGDFIDYTLRVNNVSGTNLNAVRIVDQLPFGFVYQQNTARLENQKVPNPQGGGGPRLQFNVGALPNNATLTLTYRVRITPGATQGDGVNTAQAFDDGPPPRVSNQARTTVRLTGGVFTERGIIVGKVFVDENRNRIQDPGELGVPGVRLFLEDGTFVITDSEGKYDFYGLRPIAHVVKVDLVTLPKGAELEELSTRDAFSPSTRFVEMKRYELHKADFALLPGPVEMKQEIEQRRKLAENLPVEMDNAAKATLRRENELPVTSLDAKTLPASGLVGQRGPPSPGAQPPNHPGTNVTSAPPSATASAAVGETGSTVSASGAISGGITNMASAGGGSSNNVFLPVLPSANEALNEANSDLPFFAHGSPQVSLQEVLTNVDNTLGFVNLHEGDTLPMPQVTVWVKGMLGAKFGLQVNGVEVPATRLGKRASITARQLEAWQFVGVDLKPGTNRLTVLLRDPFGNTRGSNSIVLVAPDKLGQIKIQLPKEDQPADGKTPAKIVVRLQDAKGVPVTARTPLTLQASLGEWLVPDLNKTEPGVQVFIEGGRAEYQLKPPLEPGDARITVNSGSLGAETTLAFMPELRPFMGAGLVQGTISLRSLASGSILPARSRDGFEEELRNWQATWANGQAAAGARAAFYLKGKIKGDYLLTAAYDSDKDTRERLFRDIQPDEFYPIYGDSAVKGFDAQSTSRFYIRIDQRKCYLLYGDYVTSSATEARQLGNYNRALTGAKAHYEKNRVSLNAWASQDTARQVIEEVPANGTSGPYFFGIANGIVNSEVVQILTRDRHQPALILETVQLTRFADYEFEPFTGRLLLKAPVPSLDANLNPISVRITYEVDQGGDPFWVYGADAQAKVTKWWEVGGAGVRDENPLGDYGLYSANTTFKLANKTYLLGEVAQSDAVGTLGDAERVELRHTSDKTDLRAYYARANNTFSNSAAMIPAGRVEAGLKASYKLSQSTRLVGQAINTESLVDHGNLFGAQLGIEHTFTNQVKLEFGGRYAKETEEPANASSSYPPGTTPNELRTLGLKLTAPIPKVKNATAYVQYEFDVVDSGEQLVAVGGEARILGKTRLYGRYEFINSLNAPFQLNGFQQQNTGVIGLESDYMKDGKSFNEYRMRDAITGREAEAATGLRNVWSLAEGVRASTSFESVTPMAGELDTEATALTGGIEYTRNPDWKGTARLELRSATANDSLLNTLGYARKVSRDWTFLGRSILYLVDNNGPSGGSQTQARFQSGFAWRETTTDRWNALMKYEFKIENNSTQPPVDLDRKVNILLMDVNFQPAPAYLLSGHFASKLAFEKSKGVEDFYDAHLVAFRLTYEFNKRYDIGFNTSTLFSGKDGSIHYGVGPEIGLTVLKNIRLGFGYNIFGFRDPDLSAGQYTEAGFYVALRMKFDESLLGLGKQKE
jgi:uncharacterized repeat protein (TIGR01451 family)